MNVLKLCISSREISHNQLILPLLFMTWPLALVARAAAAQVILKFDNVTLQYNVITPPANLLRLIHTITTKWNHNYNHNHKDRTRNKSINLEKITKAYLFTNEFHLVSSITKKTLKQKSSYFTYGEKVKIA